VDFAEAEAFAKVVAAFGAPFWAGTVLWLFYQIWKLLRGAIEALRTRDDSLQRLLDAHISQTDKRISLIEQLIEHHDASIDVIIRRMGGVNYSRASDHIRE
jgi:hypothetical protein